MLNNTGSLNEGSSEVTMVSNLEQLPLTGLKTQFEKLESNNYLTQQIITYIGNKRSLLPLIGEGIHEVQRTLNKDKLVTFDVFSGSGVVARYLKQFSKEIYACDMELYSYIINSCYLENTSNINMAEIRDIIAEINFLASKELREGFITELYAPKDDNNIKPGERAFYTRRNAMMIDTTRALIEEVVPHHLKKFVLAPLLYVASVHSNTSGVFKGFYKNSQTGVGQFGGTGRDALARICKPFDIPAPVFSVYESSWKVLLGDSNEVASTLPHVDLAYLDPPYNQHPYGSNYFMLNLIAKNQKPESISRVSGIPTDWNRSDYNKRPKAKEALRDIINVINAKYLLISFNSEGFISKEEMMQMLNQIGDVSLFETKYNTFRGSRNLRNRDIHVKEYLYLVKKGVK